MAPKKGKKGGKKGKKGEKKKKKEESVEKKAVRNEKVWQARLRSMELTKNDYRENAQYLATQNDLLSNQMKQVELDTIDVITFLKIQDQKKDTAVEKLETELKKCIQQQEQERATLVADYTEQIRSLESQMNKKQDDIVLMQNELKHVKEFRKKRVAMQRELDEIKDTMFLADKEHKDEVQKMTQKFEDEKVAMQHDTNHKISELADRAHQQAIANLEEGTRSIYKENVRLTEALRFHKMEIDRLKKENTSLEQENEKITLEQEDKDIRVQESVSNSQKQKLSISEAEEKIEALEAALNDIVFKFNKEQKNIKRYSSLESKSSDVEISKLDRLLQLKTTECARVRKLARNILAQRTEVEVSFLEALDQVKDEYSMQTGLPRKHVTVSDLPWELREVALRMLFTKMNSNTPKRIKPPSDRELRKDDSMLQLTDEEAMFLRQQEENGDKDMTFLTQGDLLLSTED